MSAFHDYVRGRTEVIPQGYAEPGMRLYRHLVYLGAAQLLEAHFPAVKESLGEETWSELIRVFVRESRWQSHYYGDLKDEFILFLEQQAG